MIRKIIVRSCALYYLLRFGKKWISFLRVSLIIFVSLLGFALLSEFGLHLLASIVLGIFIFGLWVGFDWFGLGYFQLWPVKWEELADTQKLAYSFHEKLTNEQQEELDVIKSNHPKWNM